MAEFYNVLINGGFAGDASFLSYDQFKNHLKYEGGLLANGYNSSTTDKTFYVSGTRNLPGGTSESIDVYGRYISVNRLSDDPWTLVNSATNKELNITLNTDGLNLYIADGRFDLGYYLVIKDDSTNRLSDILFDNCMFRIAGSSDWDIINMSMFLTPSPNSTTFRNSTLSLKKGVGDILVNNPYSTSLITLINSILVIGNIYEYDTNVGDVNVDLDQCVYTHVISALGSAANSTFFNSVSNYTYDKWQQNWASPKILFSAVSNYTSDKLNYLKYNFSAITVSGSPYWGTTLYSGRRDGIGALYFPEVSAVLYSNVTNGIAPLLISATMPKTSADIYNSNIDYIWGDGTTSATTALKSKHRYLISNLNYLYAEITSKNRWYIDTTNSITITVYPSGALSACWFLYDLPSEEIISSAYTYRDLYVSAHNLLGNPSSFNIDFGTSGMSALSINNGILYKNYRYLQPYNNDITTANLKLRLYNNVGQTSAFTKAVDIYNKDNHYVDINNNYDDYPIEGTFLIENFEHVYINKRFSTDIKSKFIISGGDDMYYGNNVYLSTTVGWEDGTAFTFSGANKYIAEWSTIYGKNSSINDFLIRTSIYDKNLERNNLIRLWLYTAGDKIIWESSNDLINLFSQQNPLNTTSGDIVLFRIMRGYKIDNSGNLVISQNRIHGAYNIGDNWIPFTSSVNLSSDYDVIYGNSTVSAINKIDLNLYYQGDGTYGKEAYKYIKVWGNSSYITSGLPFAGDITSYYDGTEDFPETYNNFCNLISSASNTYENQIFKIKGYKLVSATTDSIINTDYTKNFVLDAWSSSAYGPWMIVKDDTYLYNKRLSFVGSDIRNCIIYNKPSVLNLVGSEIDILKTHDAYVICQGTNSILGLKSITINSVENEIEIIGSTLYTENGFNIIPFSAGYNSNTINIIDSVIVNKGGYVYDTNTNYVTSGYVYNSCFNQSYNNIIYGFLIYTPYKLRGDLQYNQYNWNPPLNYPLKRNMIGYGENLDYLIDHKEILKPFSGIDTPPNPGKNYDIYPNYETGLFGYSRKNYQRK